MTLKNPNFRSHLSKLRKTPHKISLHTKKPLSNKFQKLKINLNLTMSPYPHLNLESKKQQ